MLTPWQGVLMMSVAMALRLARCAPRRRALLLVLCVCLLAPAPPARSLPLPQSTGLTLFVLSGTAAVLRQDGTAVSPAPNGMELAPGDQVATLARSEVRINVDDGSWVQLGAETTLTLNEKDRRSDGSLLFVATQSRGVTTARTPDHDVEIRLISGPDDVVALLRRGGMALGSDEGTGDVTTACETQQSELFFPYEDLRVPCEQNTVRTRTARGDIFDSSSKDAPVSYVSAVVSPNVPGQLPGTTSPGIVNTPPQNPTNTSGDSTFVVVGTSCAGAVSRSDVISIELSWSQSHDLDAHLSGPRFTGATTSQRFHVFTPFITSPPRPDSVSHAGLECDSKTGASIERMVILPVSGSYVAGEYHFWVHNFSAQNASDAVFQAYPASVSVFRNNVRTHGPFSVSDARDTDPSGFRSLWYVFNLSLTADGSVSVAPIQEFRRATSNFGTVLSVKADSPSRRSSSEGDLSNVRKRSRAR